MSQRIPGSKATRHASKKKVTPNDCQNAAFRSNFAGGGIVRVAISAVLGSAFVRLDDSMDLSLGSGLSGRSVSGGIAGLNTDTESSMRTTESSSVGLWA